LVIERVAVTRLQLPESAMTQLAEGMVRARQRLAQDVRSEGASQAEKIRSEAQTASRAIMAVAQAQAQEIRAAGEADAATHYVRMAQDERLAVLLRELEALPRLFGGNVTFTLDAQRSGLTGLSRLLLDGPEAVGDACVSAASSPAGEVTDGQ
jgi:membrane protease subunit HflC